NGGGDSRRRRPEVSQTAQIVSLERYTVHICRKFRGVDETQRTSTGSSSGLLHAPVSRPSSFSFGIHGRHGAGASSGGSGPHRARPSSRRYPGGKGRQGFASGFTKHYAWHNRNSSWCTDTIIWRFRRAHRTS